MRRRFRAAAERVLPHGPVDAIRQVGLYALGYYIYRYVRGAGDDAHGTAVAFENARRVIGWERTLHVFVEPSVQAWTAHSHLFTVLASWFYINAQFTITMGALAYIYIVHNQRFYFVRNMFVVAMFVAMTCFVLFPVAPPRFFPEWGFFDTVSNYTHIAHDDHRVNALFNPYASVPSMHVCFALMIAIPLSRMVKPRPLRVFWTLYPLLVVFVIVSTANHYLTDAFTGACVAAAAAWAATQIARTRPAVWRFSPVAASQA